MTVSDGTWTNTVTREPGNPDENVADCYNSGETTENARMQSRGASFCNSIANDNFGPGYFREWSCDFDYNGEVGFVRLVISFEIFENCTWKYNLDECKHCLRVPTDSYSCSGFDKKQGGVVTNNCHKFRSDPNRAFS